MKKLFNNEKAFFIACCIMMIIMMVVIIVTSIIRSRQPYVINSSQPKETAAMFQCLQREVIIPDESEMMELPNNTRPVRDIGSFDSYSQWKLHRRAEIEDYFLHDRQASTLVFSAVFLVCFVLLMITWVIVALIKRRKVVTNIYRHEIIKQKPVIEEDDESSENDTL